MPTSFTKKIHQLYTKVLILFAPLYKILFKFVGVGRQGSDTKRLILLVSRPQDVELLVGIHERALHHQGLEVIFWIVDKCLRRNPEILAQLKEKRAIVTHVVSHAGTAKVLKPLMQSDMFLSTVESTTAKNKLPHIITKLANALQVQTFTLQHGFENVGLTYQDKNHGPEVRFAAKTVLTWGQAEGLPDWVDEETRSKAFAVGCPKLVANSEKIQQATKSERPIIAIFDNFHWDRYDEKYIVTFLGHLEEAAQHRPEFRFILKSHPGSVRNRSNDLTSRLRSMVNVDIADMSGEKETILTTPSLLTHALGVITTPSTIALDSILAGVPVAVTRYGLDLDYYTPLTMLDKLEDWLHFLDLIKEKSTHGPLKANGKQFLKRVIVPGDAVDNILKILTARE